MADKQNTGLIIVSLLKKLVNKFFSGVVIKSRRRFIGNDELWFTK